MKLKKLVLTTTLSLTLFSTPLSVFAATVSEPTYSANTGIDFISPLSDVILWKYKIENGKIYKCLFNHSTGEQVSDWIYVGKYKP